MEAGKQPECEFEGDKRFPTSYSLMVPASQRGSPILDLFRLAGAKTAVLWQVEGTGPADTADGTLDHSTYAGIEIVSRYFPEPTQESFDALVAQIEKENPDVVVAAGYERACPLWGAALRHNDWTPKAMGITHCVGYKSAKEQAQDSVYGVDFVEFDPRMKGGGFIDDYWFPPVTGRNSATIFIEESFRVLKPLSDANSIPYYDEKEFHWYMAVSVASMQVLARTINESQSLDQGVLQARLGLYDHPSFLGRIGFSTWGLQNLRDVILVQADTNYDLQIVYPLGSATASFAFPIPKFDDRVFKSNYLGKTIELVLAGIIGFCIIVSIVLGALVIHFRAHRIVIAASPLFLLAILVGSILIYSTYFAWLLQAATAACYIRYWLLGLGFVMMFGSLFAKTWRVMRIFLQSNIRIFKITNTQLMLFLAVLVGIEAALLAIWSGTSRPKAVVKINDPLRPRLNQIVCQNGKSGWPMLAILFAYKLALVVYGSYMSIKVWKIPMKLFNESRSIAFSMYNMMAFGLLGFGLQVSGSITDPTMFIIRTLCIAISTFCTVLAIFLPKVMSIHTEYTTGSSRGSSFGSVLKSTDNTDGSMGERPHPTVSKAKARSHDFSLGSRPRTSSKSDSKNDSKLEASSPPPKDTHAPMTTATESAYVDKIKSLKKELKKSNKALRALQMTLLTMESPAHGDQNV
jgi:ABC-type branched-subunit amino acid transport system substrate-binding protein